VFLKCLARKGYTHPSEERTEPLEKSKAHRAASQSKLQKERKKRKESNNPKARGQCQMKLTTFIYKEIQKGRPRGAPPKRIRKATRKKKNTQTNKGN
jgi:hypothetical protein